MALLLLIAVVQMGAPVAAPKGGTRMYIAMNRFKVLKDRTKDFESIWFNRESYLHEMPGFAAFHLLKGPERDDHVLYSSHTVWQSYADFEAWTKSDAFRKAHARAGENKPTTLGHPEFEGFHVLQEVTKDGAVKRMAAE
jgi:heme-degrading monooxygenase HmoA